MHSRIVTIIGAFAFARALLGGEGATNNVVAIERCERLEWRGAPVPVLGTYQPPVGAARPAIILPPASRKRAEWSRPLAMDLSAAQSVALRVAATVPLPVSLVFASGAGGFARTFDLTASEQIVIIPVGAFARSAKGGSWDKVTGITLGCGPAPRGAELRLLGIDALPGKEPAGGEELLLLRPASRVHPLGMAWPIYAIVHGLAYEPREDQPPAFLAERLRRMHGIALPLNPTGLAASPGLRNVILLGREAAVPAGAVKTSELDAQGYSGFVIRADDGVVAIAGATRHGTGYGVARYLETQGYRFFFYEVENTPDRRGGALPVMHTADRPFFDGPRAGHRVYASWGLPGTATGSPVAAEGLEAFQQQFDRDLSWGWGEHTAGYLVPKRVYYDKHPDYYAQFGGGRHMDRETEDFRVVICTTHPDVLKISAERMLRWMERQPDRRFFSCTQGDSHEWCRCERCLAMEYEPGNCSDRMLHWVNAVARAVARRHPDKILMTYAYGPTQVRPVKIRPEKNVQVFYAAWPNYTSAPCGIRDFDAPENYLARHEMMGWLGVAPGRVGLYDYNSGGRYTLNGMAWKVKWAARHGLCGFHYCGSNVSFQQLFAYVHARLNWNPLLDVAPLQHEFIYGYYGEAAPLMDRIIRGIYDRVEYGRYDSRMHGVPPADYFSKAFVTEMLDLFDRAAATVPANSKRAPDQDILKAREIFEDNCLYAVRPAGRAAVTGEELDVFGIVMKRVGARWLADHRAAVAAARTKDAKLPDFGALADRVWELARVRVERNGRDPDEAPPMLLAMIADPAGTFRRHTVTEFVQKTEDGWLVPAEAFTGGRNWRGYDWLCPARDAAVVYGTMTEHARMTAKLVIAEAPPAVAGMLDIEGQDSDKRWCPPVPIQILVNNTPVFEGTNPFVKCGWSRHAFPLPPGVLRKGENRVEIRNLIASDSAFSHWCMVSEVRVRIGASD